MKRPGSRLPRPCIPPPRPAIAHDAGPCRAPRRSTRHGLCPSRHRLVVPMVLALVLCAPAVLLAQTLTILHTNDTHGHLLPFSYPSTAAPGSTLADLPERTDIGGIARRATLVRQIREECDASGTEVWLVDAGDVCDGTPFSTEYHGDADIEAMNAAGYDFATIGNHEFNNTLAQLQRLVGAARFRMLCGNATLRDGGAPLAPAYVIENVGPVRVAVMGLTTYESATYPAAKEGVDLEQELPAARRLVAELKGKADVIVLISHMGLATDREIARAVPEIDVIVGGHSHSRIPSGEFLWRSADLVADDVNGTIIVQAHQWGGELGRLDLLFTRGTDGQWGIDRYRSRLIPVTAEIAEDAATAAVVSRYWDPIAATYGEVLGQAEADFAGRGDDRAEYNFVADVIREVFGTEIELENLGGVRAPIIQGPITRADMVDLDPFGNTIVTFSIRGADLRALLERHTPAVSGIRYRVENEKLVEAFVGGSPLEDDRVYSGAANSYFAKQALKGIETKDTGQKRLDVLIDYIKTRGAIRPAYDGRRVVID